VGAIAAALEPTFPHFAHIALEKPAFNSRLKYASLKILILLMPA